VAVPPFPITGNINGNTTALPTVKTAYHSSPVPHNVYRRLLRSDNPICTYTLRCLLWAWQLDSACNTVRYFVKESSTLPHCRFS